MTLMMKQRFQALLYIVAILAAIQITGCRSSQPVFTDPNDLTGNDGTNNGTDGSDNEPAAENPLMVSLSAELVGTADIEMGWVWSNANSTHENIEYYNVERSTNGGLWETLATITVTGDAETSYTDAPTGGTSFRYRFVIHYVDGTSSTSSETAPITVITHLNPPTNFGASFSQYHASPFGWNDVYLTWSYATGAANVAGFNVVYTVRDGEGNIVYANMSVGVNTMYYSTVGSYNRYHDNIHQVATACAPANAATIEYKVQAVPTNYGQNSPSVFVSVAEMPCP